MQSVTIHIAGAWLASVALLSIRFGIVLAMTPVLGGTNLPVRMRVLLVIAFSAAFTSLLELHGDVAFGEPLNFLFSALNEVLWGGLLAFGLLAAFSAFMVGGRMLDLEIGFNLANLLDPTTRTHAPILGAALHLYAIAWLLAADAHHAVLRGLKKSLALVPLGSSLTAVPLNALVHHFALMFSLGLVLVGAVVVCLLLIDIGMGIASRVMPQANVFVLSPPVKILAGLAVLALAIPYMQPVMKKIFGLVFDYWEMVLVK